MSIEVKCPKGHRLRVSEKFGGRKARCPSCKSILLIPKVISDDDIVSLIGPSMAKAQASSDRESLDFELPQSTGSGGSSILGSEILRQHNKVCPNCEDVVPATFRVCPHCHIYLTDWR